MKRILLLLILSFLAVSWHSFAASPDGKTVKECLDMLSERHVTNFIYDASLPLDRPYRGRNLEDLPLDRALALLFRGSGIRWERKGAGYVVLTYSRTDGKGNETSPQPLQDTISESVVVSVVDRYRSASQTGLTRLDYRNLSPGYAFLSSPDLVKAIQALPGVAAGTELMSGLYVRGGTGSDNLFLLDGAPLYQISHVGGFFSSFNTDIIDNVDFYKSGFPARYGSRLSSVVDVTTRDGNPESFHGNFSIGLIEGRLQLEGPIVRGKTSFNVAMRRSWLDVVTLPVIAVMNRKNGTNQKIRYAFHDINAKVTHRFSDVNSLSLNFYNGLDLFRFNLSDKAVPSEQNPGYTNRMTDAADLRWGNLMTSLVWKYDFSAKSSLRMIAYYSGFGSDFGFGTDSRSWNGGENIFSMNESNVSKVSDIGYLADFSTRLRHHHLRYGAGYQFHTYNPERKVFYNEVLPGADDIRNTQRYSAKYYGHEAYVYLEDDMMITDWMRMNFGGRAIIFGVQGTTYFAFEPRIAFRFQCADVAVIKVSYMAVNQFSHQVASTYLDIPTSCWLPSTSRVWPMLTRHAAMGVVFALPGNFSLNLEGFLKTLEHIREYGGKATIYPPLNDWENQFREGKGRAYGLEAEFAYRTAKTCVSAAYTLSWSERRFDDFWTGWYPDRNDNRHKLTITATHKFSDRFDIYAAWHYHTGNRMTASSQSIVYGDMDYVQAGNAFGMELYSQPNNVKLPDYHRLDLGVNFRRTTRRGNESIWNISVYNAYCRMNAVFAYVETQEDGRRVGKATGLVPIIPSFSYTLKF